MSVIGYMRVSTHYQKFDSQEVAMERYQIDRIYREHDTGTNPNRKRLNEALASLKPGDTFIIFKLDRLARNTKHLLLLMESFERNQINFISIQDQINTSTAMGRFFFTVMSAFAEMEAELTRERVLAGLKAARKNGKTLGRPRLLAEINEALDLYQHTTMSIEDISEKCQISVSAIYKNARIRNISRKSHHYISKMKKS